MSELYRAFTYFSFYCYWQTLIDIPVGVTSSQTAIKICRTTAGITNYKKKKKKKKKKHDKVIRKNGDKLYVKWKGNHNSFNIGFIEKISLYKMSYFPEPYTCSKNKIKCELDLSNHATKSDLRKRNMCPCIAI